jgi:hypothetical protein
LVLESYDVKTNNEHGSGCPGCQEEVNRDFQIFGRLPVPTN